MMSLLHDLPAELYLRIFNFCSQDDLCSLSKTDKRIRTTVNRLWRDTNLASAIDSLSWSTHEVLTDLRGFKIVSQQWQMKCTRHELQQWANIANNVRILIQLGKGGEHEQKGDSCSLILSHPDSQGSIQACKVVLMDGRGMYPAGLYENKTVIDARIVKCAMINQGLRTPSHNSGLRTLNIFQIRALRLTFEDYSSQYLSFLFMPATAPRNDAPDAQTLIWRIFPQVTLDQLPGANDSCNCWVTVPDIRRILSIPFRYWHAMQTNTNTITYLQGIVDVFGIFTEGTIDREGPMFSEIALLRAASTYDLVLNLNTMEEVLLVLYCKLGEIVGPVSRPLTMVLTSENMALLQGTIRPEDMWNFEKLVRCYNESSGFPFHAMARECAELQNLCVSLRNEQLAEEWALVVVIGERIGLDCSSILDKDWAKVVGFATLESYYLFPESGLFSSCSSLLITGTSSSEFRDNFDDLIGYLASRRVRVSSASFRITRPNLMTLNRIADICDPAVFDVVLELRQIRERPCRVYLRQCEQVNLNIFGDLASPPVLVDI